MKLSVSTAMLLLTIFALAITIAVQRNKPSKPVVFQNFDEDLHFWLTPEKLDAFSSWDPRLEKPSLSFAEASKIAFAIENALDTVDCEYIERWETASIAIASLDGPFTSNNANKKWCYAVLYIAQRTGSHTGPPPEFTILINFDGTAIVPVEEYLPDHRKEVLAKFGGPNAG